MLFDLTQNRNSASFLLKNYDENKMYTSIIHEIKKLQENFYFKQQESEVQKYTK